MNVKLINHTLLFVLLIVFSHKMLAQDWLKKGKELLTNNQTNQSVEHTEQDLNTGLKEALSLGVTTVVNNLSAEGAFLNDQNIHIPLPDSLKKVDKILKKIGYSELTSNLESKLNYAAELATPEAKAIFLKTIEEIKIEDLKSIYNGNDDAATQYLKAKMSEPLAVAFKPIVDQQLETVGALTLYEQAMTKYKSIPFVPNVKKDLNRHVINKALDGIFFYLAKEEEKIRNDPLKQSTRLLKKLFSK